MTHKLVDVYPYIVSGRDAEHKVRFLILKRSMNVIYAKQWRMIGGKVHSGEHRAEAAVRELQEETGSRPEEIWTVPDINQFYDVKTDTINHIAVFAARLNSHGKVRLNHEHDCYKWISVEEVATFIRWPEQVRLINLIHDILTQKEILPEWRV